MLSDIFLGICGKNSLRYGLNAPSGAQCFPTLTRDGCLTAWGARVSMHLLVLSAFRLVERGGACCRVGESQCTFWCSVLSDVDCAPSPPPASNPVSMHLLVLSAFRPPDDSLRTHSLLSQCTFWCSVLSDSAPRKPRHNAVYRNEIAADLESTTSNRPAPVQLNHTTAKYRHKPPQRRRRPLPTSTPPASNEPKPKNRRLTTTPESTSSYWASRILCCKVMPILPAE